MSVALILAGHGSHISPNTAGVVWDYVDELRRRGVADEITACFWKEQPHFHQVLQTVKSETVVIVPLFTAVGYFSQQVIPAEMGLTGQVTQRDGRIIHYTHTMGEHPSIDTIVRQRVTNALQAANLSPDETAIAIIGHGTQRNPTTRETVQRQVNNLRESKIAIEIVDAYLDDDPDIPSIYERTSAPNVIAVPFFLAAGSHTTQDVPDALGIHYGDHRAQVKRRNVYYTPPLGTDDDMCDLILQLAHTTGLPFAEKVGDMWSGFPQVGISELLAAIPQKNHIVEFGQLAISQDSVQPIDSTEAIVLHDLVELRQHIRENPFRSLTTSDDLPADWIVPIHHMEHIAAVVETIYPGAVADWAANRRGDFHTEALSNVLQRQQGIFKSLADTDGATIAHHMSSVCGRCMRHPTWHYGHTPTDSIPCSSPCNHWLSSIKEIINEG